MLIGCVRRSTSPNYAYSLAKRYTANGKGE
jgi:hypothetical protein